MRTAFLSKSPSSFLFSGLHSTVSDGGSSGPPYIREVVIDYTNLGSSTLTDFPMLFKGTYDGTGGIPDLRTTANGGKVENANGYDICFYADSGRVTMLDFERVSWDATTGVCEFWVKVPSISHLADTTIYLGYGDSSITTDQQDMNNTWMSEFKGVYHMKANSNDSSGNGYNGTDNTMNYSTSYGIIAEGGSFEDGTDHISLNGNPLVNFANGGAIEYWIYPKANGSSGAEVYMQPATWGLGNIYCSNMILNAVEASRKLRLYYWNGSAPVYHDSTNNFPFNAWYHIIWTWDSSGSDLYINGNVDSSPSGFSLYNMQAIDPSGQTLRIGAQSTLYRMNGYLDEFRFRIGSKVNASYALACCNNQSSPDSFYTIGSETGA